MGIWREALPGSLSRWGWKDLALREQGTKTHRLCQSLWGYAWGANSITACLWWFNGSGKQPTETCKTQVGTRAFSNFEVCEVCPPGRLAPEVGAPSCQKCPAGQWQREAGVPWQMGDDWMRPVWKHWGSPIVSWSQKCHPFFCASDYMYRSKKNPLLARWTLRKLRPRNATCVRLAPPIPVRAAAALLGGRLPISSSGRDSQSVKACLTHSRHNGLIQVCISLCIQCAIQSYRHMRRKQVLSIMALIPYCNPCDPPSQWKSIPSSIGLFAQVAPQGVFVCPLSAGNMERRRSGNAWNFRWVFLENFRCGRWP